MIGDPTRVGDIAEIIGPLGSRNIGRRLVVTGILDPARHVLGSDRSVVLLRPMAVTLIAGGNWANAEMGAGSNAWGRDAYLKPIRDAEPPEAETIVDELEFLI